MAIIICKICDHTCSKSSFGAHLRSLHNISKKLYFDKYLGNPNRCRTCGEETNWNDQKFSYRKYCSNACVGKDPKNRKINSEKMKANHKNPVFKKAHAAWTSKYLKKAHQDSTVHSKRLSGIDKARNTKKYKEMLSNNGLKAHKNFNINTPYPYKNTIMRSLYEVRFATLCDKNNVEWEYETKIFKGPFGAYVLDFFLPEAEEYVEIKGKDRSKRYGKKILSVKKFMKEEDKELHILTHDDVIPFLERRV